MSTITRYVIVDSEDHESPVEYERPEPAIEQARQLGHAVIAREYEFVDSELIWTPDGSSFWPPDHGEEIVSFAPDATVDWPTREEKS